MIFSAKQGYRLHNGAGKIEKAPLFLRPGELLEKSFLKKDRALPFS